MTFSSTVLRNLIGDPVPGKVHMDLEARRPCLAEPDKAHTSPEAHCSGLEGEEASWCSACDEVVLSPPEPGSLWRTCIAHRRCRSGVGLAILPTGRHLRLLPFP